jgi:hypothetical protein
MITVCFLVLVENIEEGKIVNQLYEGELGTKAIFFQLFEFTMNMVWGYYIKQCKICIPSNTSFLLYPKKTNSTEAARILYISVLAYVFTMYV